MSDKFETLGMEPRENGFVLFRIDDQGVRTELALSEANVSALAKQAPLWLQELLAKRQSPQMSQQGISPVIVNPVKGIALNTDVHGTEIHVGIDDQFGNRNWFALTLDLASRLSEALPKYIQRARHLASAGRPQ